MWKVYDNNNDNDDRQQTNFDQKSSRAFGSGELKTKQITKNYAFLTVEHVFRLKLVRWTDSSLCITRYCIKPFSV